MFAWWKIRKLEPELGSLDSKIRRAALEKLGEIGGSGAVDRLVDAALDTVASETAISVLRRMDDGSAVDRLLGVLRSGDTSIQRASAAAALGYLASPIPGDPGAKGPAPSPDGSLFRALRARAVPALGDALRTMGAPTLQRAAARSLGKIQDPLAFPALFALLASRPWLDSREARARATGVGLSPEALEAQVREDETDVRGAIAEAIGEIGDPRAVGELLTVLPEGGPLSMAVLRALGRLGDPSACQWLEPFLTADDERREAAAASLERLGWTPANSEERARYAIARRRYADAGAEGEVAVDGLLRLLNRDGHDMPVILAALGRTRSPRIVKPLEKALLNVDPEVRRAIVAAVAEVEGPGADALLEKAAGDRDKGVRAAAGEARARRGASTPAAHHAAEVHESPTVLPGRAGATRPVVIPETGADRDSGHDDDVATFDRVMENVDFSELANEEMGDMGHSGGWRCACGTVIPEADALPGRTHVCAGCGRMTRFDGGGASEVARATWTQEDFARSRSGAAYAVGDVIAQAWQVEAVRSGGMSHVYLCTSLNFEDHRSALKVIQDDPLAHPKVRAAMRREADAWLRLSPHPNVVHCMGIHLDPYDRKMWLELERIEGSPERGTSLQDWLESGRLTPEEIVRFSLDIARGLRHSYSSGSLLHRDLKPDNVLITREGVARVSDFGLAGRLEDETSSSGEGPVIAGTPAYMAPELWWGIERSSTRSDVYAFGVMLYYMLTGRHPFCDSLSSREAICHAHLERVPPDPREIETAADPVLAQLARECLAKSPSARPCDFAHIHASLAERFPDLARLQAPEPSGVDLQGELGRFESLLLLGRHQEACALVDAALAADPSSPHAHLAVTRIAAYNGRPLEALSSWEFLAAWQPADFAGLFVVQRALRAVGRNEESLAVLDRMIGLEPDHRLVRHSRGLVLEALGRIPEALVDFEHAARLGGVESLVRIALIRLRQGLQPVGLRLLQESLDRNPNDPETLMVLAKELRDLGQVEAADSCLARLTVIMPDSGAPLRMKGSFLAAAGAGEAAADTLRQAMDADPDEIEAAAELAIVLHRLGRDDEATAVAQEGIRRSPRSSRGHMARGLLLDLFRCWQESIPEYQAAILLDPTMDLAWERLGQAQLRRGLWEESHRSLQQAARLGATGPEAVRMLESARLMVNASRMDVGSPARYYTLEWAGLLSGRVGSILAEQFEDGGRMGWYSMILPVIDHLVEDDPGQLAYQINRARLLLLLGLPGAAEEVCVTLVTNPAAAPEAGPILAEAREKRAKAMAPSELFKLCLDRGISLAEESQRTTDASRWSQLFDAEQALRLALILSQEDPSTRASLGALLASFHPTDRPAGGSLALELLGPMTGTLGGHPNFLYSYGRALLIVGHEAEARQAFERLASLDPHFPSFEDTRAGLAARA